MNVNWLGVAAAAMLLAFVIELLRRGILRERFAALWLIVSTLLMLGALFPGFLGRAAQVLGFQVAANLLFFSAILFLLLVAIQLSNEVSRLEARTRRLAEDLALLSLQVQPLPGAGTGTEPGPDEGREELE